MKLTDNWREILQRAWSIRLIVLAGLLSGVEVLLGIFADSPPIPRGTFAAISGIVTMGAFVARIVAQKDVAE